MRRIANIFFLEESLSWRLHIVTIYCSYKNSFTTSSGPGDDAGIRVLKSHVHPKTNYLFLKSNLFYDKMTFFISKIFARQIGQPLSATTIAQFKQHIMCEQGKNKALIVPE